MLEIETDHGKHVIEETVKVYLDYDGEQWRVAPSTLDGHPLDGQDDEPYCDISHEAGAVLDECHTLLNAAGELALPTAQELIVLISEGLEPAEVIDVIAKLAGVLGRFAREPKHRAE